MWTVVCLFAAVSAIAPPPPGPISNKTEWVEHEYRASTTFKYKYITGNGGINNHPFTSLPYITIKATSRVSDLALHKASLDVSLMVRHMPKEVFNGISKSNGVGIFSRAEGMVIFPENKNLRSTPACKGLCGGSCAYSCTADGRKFDTIAGLTNTMSSVLDDNVLCDSNDEYKHKENLMVHEFGHLTMRYMPRNWEAKIHAAYNNAYQNRLWKLGTYGMINADEYFAEATASFFMAITRLDVNGGMNQCGTSRPCQSEAASRDYIKRHDPKVFEILSYAYTNGHPEIRSGLRPCI